MSKDGVPAVKLPKTIGACADRLYAIKAEKSALAKQTALLDEERVAIEEHVIATVPKGDTGAQGKVARVTVTSTQVPSVKDWMAFLTYIVKKKSPELVEHRPGRAAIAERWAVGEDIPGVEPFGVKKVSVNKL